MNSEFQTSAKSTLLIASNRGPITFKGDDESLEVERGSGGLVSGIQVALKNVGGATWVCAAMNEDERRVSSDSENGLISELPSIASTLRGEFAVAMIPIEAYVFKRAYNGVANSTLWFLLHRLFDITSEPIFDRVWKRQWEAYRTVNDAFARRLAGLAAENAKVLVQDYHLFLVPKLLRSLRPDLRISLFVHTPWVTESHLRVLPDDVRVELLEGMLGADLIGFHTDRWAALFAETVSGVSRRDETSVRVFPLGINKSEIRLTANSRSVEIASAYLDAVVGDRILIGRVDRTEPSKNVLRGLLAYREFLRVYPFWRNRVVHAVFNNPSREDLPAYREYTSSIQGLADDIIEEFGTNEWTPLIFDVDNDYPFGLAILKRSNVILVNPIRDGMNLVVLEALLISENSPAIVLSREAGAAEVLERGALMVNPFDISETANALHRAISMPSDERVWRAEAMRAAAGSNPPDVWFTDQVDALG